MKIASHTLVRNGMPFIGLVLRQVVPYMDRCLVTISMKSDDGTFEKLENLTKEYPNKVEISFENVKNFSDLTQERQKQIDRTTEDWVLFLDDDDYWPTESLEFIIKHYLKEDVDALSVRPYQIIDKQYYDTTWKDKWFTKWFKNQPGVRYRHPWPKDMLFLNDDMLYWKKNTRVPCIPEPYFHLSNIKKNSFRNEEWAEKYKQSIGTPYFIPEIYKKDMEKIYGTRT